LHDVGDLKASVVLQWFKAVVVQWKKHLLDDILISEGID
jgi:hypothetical protein